MTAQAMMISNESSPWEWPLPRHQARRIAPARAPRWLAVRSGGVWITRSRDDFAPVEDVWLGPGETLLLPAGTEWVAEGRPEARVVLLMAAPSRRSSPDLRLAWHGAAGWLRGWFAGHAARATGAKASAGHDQRCIRAGESIALAGHVR